MKYDTVCLVFADRTCGLVYVYVVMAVNDVLSPRCSELILSNVHVEASGEWKCVVSTGRGNTSRSVEIVVLENSASFCPEERATNNRGEFK